MTPGKSLQIAILPIGPVKVATLLFRVAGQLQAAAIIKASFIVAPDGPALPTRPDPLVPADEHQHRDPAKSVIALGDLAPYRPRADVLLVGHARTPMGKPAPWVGVRLMVARSGHLSIDKRLLVRGPPDPASPENAPAPFDSVLLSYELAGGGEDNPAGGGAWPRVLDRWHRALPLGFGPIGRSWPPRRRLLPDARFVDEPVPDFPPDFPWAYFNAAPEDQRIDFLHGDEWIGFEGTHSQLPRVQTRLPDVRGVARVYGPGPGLATGADIHVQADTLFVNADRMRMSLVWRGRFLVPAGVDPAVLRVVAGIQTAERRIVLPCSYEAALKYEAASSPAGDAADLAPDTQDDSKADHPRRVLPFADALDVLRSLPSAEEEPPSSTIDYSEDLAVVGRSAAVIPFVGAAAAQRGPPSRPLPPATPFDRLALMGARRAVSPPRLEVSAGIEEPLPQTPVLASPPPVYEVPVVAPEPLVLEPPLVSVPPPLIGAPAAPAEETPAPSPMSLGAFFLAAIERLKAEKRTVRV